MFSGIIEEVGIVIKTINLSDSKKITISCNKVLGGIEIGDSVSINGVCLTITNIGINQFEADIINETLEKTTLATLHKGSKVNLERSLQYSQRIGGHLVQGHVDTIGEIINLDKTDEWTEIMIDINTKFQKYCIYKGSIAIDGVSLTIADIKENKIKIALIPHTLNNTILSGYMDGQSVNIETDMYGKYIENFSKVSN